MTDTVPGKQMKRLALLIVLSLAPITLGQDNHNRIGEIDFYGYAGLDLDQIRAALPLREGDNLPSADDAFFDVITRIRESVKGVIGKAAMDVAPVCCDAQGHMMIYIGLPGNSMRNVPYNAAPKGRLRLPSKALKLYEQSMAANSAAVRNGASEDDSKGYALSSDPTLRARELATREYATHHERLVLEVLDSSRDAEQRRVAAHFLGYARQSRVQITALVRASHDADETVRNNAVRALGVLAKSNPKVAAQIPAEGFVAMLSSGSWTDRNKAGWLLSELSTTRNRKLLDQLRAQALDSLIEMARWRSYGHAYSSRILLGRIAGIEETRLQNLVDTGQVEQIVKALEQAR
jgi:hypothetical protein